MDFREKLIKLIECGVPCPGGRDPFGDYCDTCQYSKSVGCSSERLVDYLISHGVTVQEWVSVKEPPKKRGCYLVTVKHWLDGKPVTREAYWNGCDWLSCDKKQELTPRVTHWMTLPEPPKGE